MVHNQLCKSAASRGRWECNTLDMLVTRVQPPHSEGGIFKKSKSICLLLRGITFACRFCWPASLDEVKREAEQLKGMI